MKTYCCHVGNWKMAQFKGMSHDQIEGIYYRVKRQDSNFIPMDLEPEAKKSKRSGVSLESKDDKKLKTQKLSQEMECHTPKIPEWQRNGIPEGVTDHSTQARKY
jgi:hypothetical protein